MTMALSLLYRVAWWGAEKGEDLEVVLRDYPKLTGGELETVWAACGGA